MYRFRYLDEADAARWPGWYEVDVAAFANMDSGVVMEWEEATGYRAMDSREDSPSNLLEAAKRRDIKALLATQWLAVRLSGNTTPWAEFRPKAMQVEYPPELLAAVEADVAAEESGEGNPKGPTTNRATRRAKSASAAETSPPARKAAARRRSGS